MKTTPEIQMSGNATYQDLCAEVLNDEVGE
jgi:hypothetical protein